MLQYLKALKSVRNSRDLADSVPGIKPGRVFRSACPITPSEEDARILIDKLKIRHLVDLRSDYERRTDPVSPLLHCACIKQSQRYRGGLAEETIRLPAPVELAGSVEDMSQLPTPLMVHQIALLERSRYYRALIMKIPLTTSASIVGWGLWDRSWAKSIAIKEVNRMGLPGLYETILETSGPELCQALKVVSQAAQNSEPVLVFCKVGKDRTGMLACLIAACCGATPSQLVADYHKSDGVGEAALGDVAVDKELAELDVVMFSKAPAQAMEDTLAFLSTRYGGINGYMDSIGFDKAARAQLAASMSS